MSSQRGNCAKSGPRKHQNTTAYRNDLHRKKDKTMKILNSLQITGCCKRCKEVIEWKIKYNKYKPLTRPKKCVKCLQKTVTNSYYILCQSCIENENLCGKCASIPPADASAESSTAVGNEANTKSGITSSKTMPTHEEEDSDCDDSGLDNEVEKALTINDKDQVSIKAEKKDGMKRKNANKSKASDKHKVTFETSDSERDSDDELVAHVDEDKDKLDQGKEKLNKDKLDKGKRRLNEDNAKSKEDKNKLDDGKDKLNEDNVKACGDKSSTNVDKGEDDHSSDDQSELDEDESDDDEDGEEDDGDDEEDEDDD